MKQAYFLSHIGKNNQFCCIALTKYLPYKHNLFFIFHYIFHNYKNSSSLLIKSFQIKNRIPQKAKCDLCKLWSGQRGSNSLPPPWQGGALPDELNPQIWCFRTESNHRHEDFQSSALPTELQRQIINWRPGWESNPRPLA